MALGWRTALTFAALAGTATAAEDANRYGVFEPVSERKYVPMTSPRFAVASACGLAPGEPVLGIDVAGDARCYPLRLMTYHHVVNDRFGERRVAVTYCGLANTALAFDLDVTTGDLRAAGMFGGMLALCPVSGDSASGQTVWAQLSPAPVPGHGGTGWLRESEPLIQTTFGQWQARHPETQVLMPETRFEEYYRAYDLKPKGFEPMPTRNQTILSWDERLPPATEVLGIAVKGDAVAATLDSVREQGELKVRVGDRDVLVVWDEDLGTARVETGADDSLCTRSYWYAWGNFYPETRLVEPQRRPTPEAIP